jgi:hypothetical protein
MMLKTQSMVLAIMLVSAALLLVGILAPDSFALGVPPLSPKPRLYHSPPGQKTPNNALMKKGTAVEDLERLDTNHSGGHLHPPHFPHQSKEQFKKCKDMYGNLVSCWTLKCKDIYGNLVPCSTLP